LKEMRHSSDQQLFQRVQKLRLKRNLPRWIIFSDGDHRLPVDLDNVLSVETFAHLVCKREEAILLELFPEPDPECAHGPDGTFVHEIVIPFVRKNETRTVHSQIENPPAPIARTFPPGSEWLYFKLYAGTVTADSLLTELAPVILKFCESGIVDQWFFIRYSDPDWHLRFRLHGAPKILHSMVLPAFQDALQPYLQDGRIWRVQLDTYEREVERYGGAQGLLLAEEFFHIDSESVVEILQILQNEEVQTERWKLALLGVDLLLNDLSFDFSGRLSVMKQAAESLSLEFRIDKQFKRSMAARFREERKGLEFIHSNREESPLSPEFLQAFAKRSARLKETFRKLKTLEDTGFLSLPMMDLAQSYIHMHVNRLLSFSQREQELVLYDFLHQLYRSRNARL
jgi:class I lanthipeptide synthase